MKHILLPITIIVLLLSCNKEKQKPRWELLPIMDKTENLGSYLITNPFISDNGDFYIILGEGYHEYHTSIYQSSDEGENWNKLLIDGGAFGQVFDSFSYVDENLLVVNAGTSASAPQSLRFLDLNTNTTTSMTIPDEAQNIDWSPGAIHFLDDQIGFLGTNSIWKTVDGGANWSNDIYPYSEDINGFSFVDDVMGYAISHHNCLYTNDSGESWDTVFTSTNSFSKIQMASQNMGVIGGDKIWVTSDGGITWDIVLDEKVLDVSMNENGFIYAISEANEVFRSINSGQDWSKRSFKKEGFTSVYSTNDITIAGMSNGFDNKENKEIKDGVVIGRLKN